MALAYRIHVGGKLPKEFELSPGQPVYVDYNGTDNYTIEIVEDGVVILRMGSRGMERAIWEHPTARSGRATELQSLRSPGPRAPTRRLMVAPHAL